MIAHNEEFNHIVCNAAANLVEMCLAVDQLAPSHILGVELDNGDRYMIRVQKVTKEESAKAKDAYKSQQTFRDNISLS